MVGREAEGQHHQLTLGRDERHETMAVWRPGHLSAFTLDTLVILAVFSNVHQEAQSLV